MADGLNNNMYTGLRSLASVPVQMHFVDKLVFPDPASIEFLDDELDITSIVVY